MGDFAARLNDCNNSLRKAIELGEVLNVAYNKFVAEKRESKLDDTWKSWIESFTKISERYSRQLRKMADLIGKYPKLKQLGLAYTDVFKLKAKIEKEFAKNNSLAKQWQ